MSKLLERARELQVGAPATVSTPYVNTIPPEQEPFFPGDEDLERRIRAFIRWNAAVMVVKANKLADGIGGHLATFASSAALYEVGFNHFFRRSEEHTSELQSLMRISYAVFCLKKKKNNTKQTTQHYKNKPNTNTGKN